MLRVAENRPAGRPLSARSAWALIALAEGDQDALGDLAPAERARARARLDELFALVVEPPQSEEGVRRIAVVLRSLFRNRASRELRRAASADLPGLRGDGRFLPLGLSAPASGIGVADIAEGYLAAGNCKALAEDFLLVPADRDANVVLHVVAQGRKVYAGSRLLLAADLAEHRGPREERRAVELLRESAEIYQEGGR